MPRVNLLFSLLPESDHGASEVKVVSEEGEEPITAEVTDTAAIAKQQYLDAKCRNISTQVIRDVSFVQATFPLSIAAMAQTFHPGSESPPLDHIRCL